MELPFAERRKLFEAYLRSTDAWVVKLRPRELKSTCPCCAFPTLGERGENDICPLCKWQDDIDEEKSGANGDYTIQEARENFEQFLIMYRASEQDIHTPHSRLVPAKRALIAVYMAILDANLKAHQVKSLWRAVESLHDAIHS